MSKLEFIGSGSAFNTKLGNNGAFIKRGNVLFLIDCGSSTFERIQRFGLLDGVEKIYVLMTHLHPDHVGSLGDLIFYGYYGIKPMMEPSVTVFAPYELTIRHLLRGMGVVEDTYELVQFSEQGGVNSDNLHIGFVPVVVDHVKELKCFGYIISFEGLKIYYSGDSNMIPHDVLNSLHNNEIDLFYQDTCKADYEGNVHLSLRKLDELVNVSCRNKIYCMHLDGGFDSGEAEGLGFNVVKNCCN